ncbi:MAG: hypothetical protein DCC74_06255 [Proteobacteria bacterium]|nr:MAG: hypothetical protein DCC74_06255 [Pseudomonadota bacterium]
MSDDARDPSPDNGTNDEAKAAVTPREPTEIVVYRGGADAGAGGGAGWHAARDGFGPTPEPRRGWGGRVAALVAVAALIGAVGGSLAATTFGSALSSETTKVQVTAQAASADELKSAREAIARLEKELAGVKADAEKTAKARTAQFGKLGERLDKAEKAQDEQAAKLAKLVEAQDKDRKTAAAAADVTGSVPKPAAAREPDRPQVVAGWRLNRIVPGGAEVESGGVRYAVYPGDPLPGVGTVAGLKRGEDGRWAVVTSKGLIVGR